jgi:NADPH:quinone reductase-like Zn-dependent oxidoreductase
MCCLPWIPTQVLIKLKYAGINGGCETFRARGEYAFAGNKSKPQFPLGAEGAGIVAAVGQGVTSLSVGQAVACNSAASFAEYGITQVRCLNSALLQPPLNLSAHTATTWGVAEEASWACQGQEQQHSSTTLCCTWCCPT